MNAYDDDQSVDIDIDRVELHERYVKVPKVNDIAIVYLVRDVEFTSKISFYLFTIVDKYSWVFSYFSHRIDRIVPICLPTTKDIQSRSFVGNMPFVGNYY